MATINNNKNYSGSHFLSKHSVKKVLPYVAASCTSVNNDESWITPLKMNLISPQAKKFPISSTTLKAHEKCYFDASSGLKISLIEGKKRMIIVFGALGSGNSEVPAEQRQEITQLQYKAGALNLLGIDCDIYDQAAQFVEEFAQLKEFKDKKIVIVGQSLGGSLAHYVGLKNRLHTYCFNPIPLGRAQLNKLEPEEKARDRNIFVISIEGDYAFLLADNPISKMAQQIINVPQLFGKKFTIPSAYRNYYETHTYFMGSVMKYLGYDIRTKIDSLPLHEICTRKGMLDLAITDIEQSIISLVELKTFLNENNLEKSTNQLQSIKNHSPWIFNYLAFVTWLANEGRDFGDWNYGEHRLLTTPYILKKISVGEIPILDSLIEHFNVILFFQKAKKSFQSVSGKLEQVSQELLSSDTIYREKSDLINIELHSILNSIGPVNKTTAFDKEALNLLLELNEELENEGAPSEKQRKIIEKISSEHPKVYCSMLLLLKQQMNDPTLKMEMLSQKIHADPVLLTQLLNGNPSILMQLIKCMERIERIHIAIDRVGSLKGILLALYRYASNKKSLLTFANLKELYQRIEELEAVFSLTNDQHRLLNSFKERIDYLGVSSKESIKPDRIEQQISGAKRICMVAAECSGIIKVGGLAEAVYGIAEGLRERGHQVVLIMPKYSTFPQDRKGEVKNSLEQAHIGLKHTFGNVTKIDRIFLSRMNGIDMLFIEDTILPGYSERDRFSLEGNELYKFPDDPNEVKIKERFAYFSQAAAELIKELKEQIDVVFFHDWHSALAIALLARNSTKEWIDRSIPPLIYVFHNNGYAAQGMLNDWDHRSILGDLKLPQQFFNMTQHAVSIADHVCTVSESYALEVQEREGNGLQKEMQRIAHQRRFSGVTNGCNLSLWNPYTEKQLVNWIDPITKEPTPIHFGQTGDVLQCKWYVKQQLQRWLFQYHPELIDRYGIDVTRDNVILYVNRYDSSQKGVNQLRFAMQVAAEKGATFITMGFKEDPQASMLLDELEKEAADLKNPSWGGAWIIRDSVNGLGLLNFQQGTEEGVPGIGHLVRAAANICFCPSEYEPCGLTHLEGFPFAQLTVGTNLGGYADIICQDIQSPLFNGFLFPRHPIWKSKEQSQAIQKTMRQAIDYWNSLSNEQKNAIMNNLIQTSRQYSWTTSPYGLTPVEKYEKVITAAEKTSESRGASEKIHPMLLSEPIENNSIKKKSFITKSPAPLHK